MKVKLLVDDIGYAQDGTVGELPTGTVVEVTAAEGEAWAFWHRMITAGRAEVVPDAPPAPELEPESEEAPKRRGRPALPRDASGNIVRE